MRNSCSSCNRWISRCKASSWRSSASRSDAGGEVFLLERGHHDLGHAAASPGLLMKVSVEQILNPRRTRTTRYLTLTQWDSTALVGAVVGVRRSAGTEAYAYYGHIPLFLQPNGPAAPVRRVHYKRPRAVRPALRSALALRSLVPEGAGQPCFRRLVFTAAAARGTKCMGGGSPQAKKGPGASPTPEVIRYHSPGHGGSGSLWKIL